jgi:hypothetical protein
MKITYTPSKALFFTCILSAASLQSCVENPSQGASGAPVVSEDAAEESVALLPDEERLLHRSAELWQHKQAGDWIQVYDFLAPGFKASMPLGKFLSGKENHIYEDASDPFVLKIEKDRGYVEVHVQWTPTHPILSSVDNAEGSLTQILDEVDEWVWLEGEWWLAQQHRIADLRTTHPRLWVRDDKEG